MGKRMRRKKKKSQSRTLKSKACMALSTGAALTTTRPLKYKTPLKGIKSKGKLQSANSGGASGELPKAKMGVKALDQAFGSSNDTSGSMFQDINPKNPYGLNNNCVFVTMADLMGLDLHPFL